MRDIVGFCLGLVMVFVSSYVMVWLVENLNFSGIWRILAATLIGATLFLCSMFLLHLLYEKIDEAKRQRKK